jgi:hypothetical protein
VQRYRKVFETLWEASMPEERSARTIRAKAAELLARLE